MHTRPDHAPASDHGQLVETRGICGHCHRVVSLTLTGTFRLHGPRTDHCPGSGWPADRQPCREQTPHPQHDWFPTCTPPAQPGVVLVSPFSATCLGDRLSPTKEATR